MATKTTTVTEECQEEVHLVNIISLAQDRLQGNFRAMLRRIRDHDRMLKEHEDFFKERSEMIMDRVEENKVNSGVAVRDLEGKIEECMKAITEVKRNQSGQRQMIIKNENSISKSNEDMEQFKLICEQKNQQLNNSTDEAHKQIEQLKRDIHRSFQEILKKEDSTEVLKTNQKLEMVHEKVLKNQKDFQHIQHKLEKMQILKQKAEREQVKKDSELMKEIEDKIKKQIKNIHKNLGKGPSILPPASFQMADHEPSFMQSRLDENSVLKTNISTNEASIRQSEEEETARLKASIKQSMEKTAISKINEKMTSFQNKLKSLEHTLNSHKSSSLRSSSNRSQSLDPKFLEKINEIKPQLIRLWAKCDTLDDKIAFTDKKMQEKTKTISSLVQAQKENNWGKMDEKLKLFQTEMYQTLKDLKNKVDNKVNSVDYEKYCSMMDERIRQINQLIFLKSDKLEVKKALLFLQSKIKEIILVISEEEENQKDALLTKKQLKCMSCDKDIDKVPKGVMNSGRGNWDALPIKDHAPELLGKFGMTNYGSLGKKLKKLESGDLPLLNKKNQKISSPSERA